MYLVKSSSGHDFYHHAGVDYINREKSKERYLAYVNAHINHGIAIHRKYISNPNNTIMPRKHGVVVPIDILCETFLKLNITKLPTYVDFAPSIDQNMRDIINKYPQMDWMLNSKIPYFTFLELFKDGNISKYPNHSMEEILSSSNGAAQYICEHGTDFIDTTDPCKIKSCWDAISCNNYISIAYILERKHLPWNWHFVSMRHDITMAIARENDVNWDWCEIYRYAEITSDDVIQAHKENKIKDLFQTISYNNHLISHYTWLLGMFSEEKWIWTSDVICRNITMYLLQKYPEICKHIDWELTTKRSGYLKTEDMLEVIVKGNTMLRFNVGAITQRSDFSARLALKYDAICMLHGAEYLNQNFYYSIETAEQARYFIKRMRIGQPQRQGSLHINCKIIDELSEEFNWDWVYVAKNPTITPAFIKKYQHKLRETDLIDNDFYYYTDYADHCMWIDIRYRRKLVAEEFNCLGIYVAHYIDWR
jgi:hypothetical protein